MRGQRARLIKRSLRMAKKKRKTVRMRTDVCGKYWQAHLGKIWMEPVWAIEGDARRSGDARAKRMGLTPEWV
jgi:hypothetical protein